MSNRGLEKSKLVQKPAHREDDELSVAARRRFLGALGLGGVAVAGGLSVFDLSVVDVSEARLPGIETAGAEPSGVSRATEAVTDKRRWGLLIDTAKCTSGCDACVRGCNEEHGLTTTGRDDIDAQWIRKIDLEDRLTKRTTSLPMLCQHCESAPCVDVCPTGASFKRADGIVLVNKHTCIGCRYCMMACPFKARSFIHEEITDQLARAPRGKGTVESCTLCVHRVDAEDDSAITACAEACSKDGHNAIVFGDLNDPDSEISRQLRERPATAVRADLELNPGVRYL